MAFGRRPQTCYNQHAMLHPHAQRGPRFLLLWVGLLVLGLSCSSDPDSGWPKELPFVPGPHPYTLLARLAHISDSHVLDIESPARTAEFGEIIGASWRTYEGYSMQLLDGTIRAVNRYHREVANIDILLHTGDFTDNVQGNELRWFLQIMDGQEVNPLSGLDDRDPATLPLPLMDPYHAFQAEGIYTQGRHGPLPTIPWYGTLGNHDVYAAGNFLILEQEDGSRISPLPLDWRPGWILPLVLVPDGEWTYGPVSPAEPGPPPLFAEPTRVTANPDRAYFSRTEFMEALFATESEPAGHGYSCVSAAAVGYTLQIAPRLRLIVADTTDVANPIPGLLYSEGAMSRAQFRWLKDRLKEAADAGDWIIVATHHPSDALIQLGGSEVTADEFRKLLSSTENVILHLAGHRHFNRVQDRGGYLEMLTASTFDYPQNGRIVEIRERDDTGEVMINYTLFSHRDSNDVLKPLREVAYELARADAPKHVTKATNSASEDVPTMSEARQWFEGTFADREGTVMLKKRPPGR